METYQNVAECLGTVCLCVLLCIYHYENRLSLETFIVWAFFANRGHSGLSRLLEKTVRGQE